jgi:hypothetical protein
MFVMVLFGIIGNLLFKGKETLRLNISDIISGHKENFRLNKNAYHITMKNGETIEIDYESDLYSAASIHDYGKAFTQTFFDLKGKPSLNAHYYGHDNYGAYLYCCCCDKPKLYIVQLINYHMLPYFMKTDKSIQKWSEILGSRLWQDLQVLNAADKHAK